MIAGLVYMACALTSLGCAYLLLKSYRQTRVPLLLWSGLCFAGLAVNNALLFVDLRMVPDIDLVIFRNVAALVAILLLLYGLIWETKT